MTRGYVVTALAASILLACGGGDDGGGGDPVVQGIGPEGGTVEGDGATLIIPAGALDEEVEIAVAETDAEAPDGFVAMSPVFEFTPDGLTFAAPIEVRITYDGADDGMEVIWSLAQGDGFEGVGGTADGETIVAEVSHFSRGFAGRAEIPGGGACEDGSQCPVGWSCSDVGVCVDPGDGPAACADGADNDDDDLIDADDDGCWGPEDDYETVDCDDGIDNDGDGATDGVTSGDTGCTSPLDPSERPGCSDGIDNDMDGFTDYPADPQCTSADTQNEAPAG